jgi:UDP-N-acetylmuramyl pentapeptide phosphotransferase/UDP-N-acetylglucosamine-1-phosphate transferase
VAAWALWALALLGLATVPWFDHLARQAGRPELTQLNASTIPYLLAIVVAATVGAVLASRLPRHPVGWLLLAVGLSVTGSGVADGYARYGLVARAGRCPPPAGSRSTARRPPSPGSPWSASSCC